MRADPWLNMLQNIEPSYDDIVHIMEKGPQYIAQKTKKGKNKWALTIVEKQYEFIVYSTGDQNKMQEIIDWVTDQLANVKDAHRSAYDQWYFKKEKDIDVFITFYNLKWAE